MPIRDAQIIETADILVGDKSSGNPYASGLSGGALENFTLNNGKLTRLPFAPKFHTSASSAKVWRIYEYNFTRDGAPEKQLLIFKDNGRVYKRVSGAEVEISPASNTISTYSGTCGTATGAGWTNPTNAQGAINTTYATDTITATINDTTSNLDLTNFSISPTGTIRGIEVTPTAKVASYNANQYLRAQLLRGGSVVGSTYVQPSAFLYPNPLSIPIGGEGSTWGSSWIASDISSSDFGVRLLLFNFGAGIANTLSVDSVTIKVYTGSASPEVLLLRKPSIAQVHDKLHISDGNSYLIYDGWNWYDGGLAAPTGTVTPSVGSATGLTGTYKCAVTAVQIRTNNGVDERVHESSRTSVSSGTALSNEKLAVDVSAATFPDRATHWSLYISELNGSNVLRRVATTALTTTSVSVSAEPSGTAAPAPVRNDPVQPSRVLVPWKNRMAMRSEVNPNEFWFSAFAEVDALLNGDGEECLPGRNSSSISDLVNSWTIPDGGSPMQAAVWHEGYLWVFTKVGGYYIRGEGAILDNRSTRDFLPQKQFGVGAAGPFAVCSTPKGLAILTPEHKLWFWPGGEELVDLGRNIQGRLDDLTEEELEEVEMLYWSGRGQSWLAVTLPDRLAVFDFDAKSDTSPLGMWFSLGSQGAWPQVTSLAVYNPGRTFFLTGHADGTVREIMQLCQPSHVGLSAVCGETYLHASVQNSPAAVARTGPISAQAGAWIDAKYVTYYQTGHTDNETTGIRTTNPTVTAYYDAVDPKSPSSGVALTSSTVNDSNERRAWFKRSGGSSGGHLCRSYQVELSYSEGADTDSASRPQLVNNEIQKLSTVHQPKAALTQ